MSAAEGRELRVAAGALEIDTESHVEVREADVEPALVAGFQKPDEGAVAAQECGIVRGFEGEAQRDVARLERLHERLRRAHAVLFADRDLRLFLECGHLQQLIVVLVFVLRCFGQERSELLVYVGAVYQQQSREYRHVSIVLSVPAAAARAGRISAAARSCCSQ